MKIVLASYFEPQYHGKGRKIGITPSCPKNLKEEHGYSCDLKFSDFSPEDIYWNYISSKKAAKDPEALKLAGDEFVNKYAEKLNSLKKTIEAQAKTENKTVMEVIGLQNEDTLLSWELKGHLTFRTALIEFLTGFGYNVISN